MSDLLCIEKRQNHPILRLHRYGFCITENNKIATNIKPSFILVAILLTMNTENCIISASIDLIGKETFHGRFLHITIGGQHSL